MPLQFTCPECKANLKLANETLAGKKIKCPKCAAVVTVPLPSAPDEEDALEETPRPAKKKAQPRADDDFAGDDRARSSKGKKKSATLLYFAIGGAAVILLGVGVTLFLVLSGKSDPKEQMLGLWKLDLAETKNINPKFEPPSGEMALEFRKEGVLLMTTGNRSEDGTWKLIKENGQQLTLEVGGPRDAKKDVVTLTVLSSAKIKVTLPEGMGEAVLVRGESPVVAAKQNGEKKEGGGMSKEEAQARINSINNVMQLALAMHGFHDGTRYCPPADGITPPSRPNLNGLSWRVHVAPYVEQDKLYLDLLKGRLKSEDPAQPWNIGALKNREVLPFTREEQGKDRWLSPYRVFIGPGAAFEKGKKITLGSGFPDGLSNTIVLVETAEMVPWTKPDELIYDPAGPLPKLGGIWPDGFYAGFADGRCRFIPSTTDEKTLRALITRNGGESIPPLPDIDMRALRKIAELKDPFSRDDDQDKRPEPASLSGNITFDGKRVELLVLAATSDDGNQIAKGGVANGKYFVSKAPTGKVTITYRPPGNEQDALASMAGHFKDPPTKLNPKQLEFIQDLQSVPKSYASPSTSGLSITVSGRTEFDIRMTSKK